MCICCTYAKLRSKLLCKHTSRRFTFRSFDATYEGSVLRVHMYLLGFAIFRTNPRGIPTYVASSMQNIAENHSWIVRKIWAHPRGYPCPSALENRGICRKNWSYPCQVAYIYTESSPLTNWRTWYVAHTWQGMNTWSKWAAFYIPTRGKTAGYVHGCTLVWLWMNICRTTWMGRLAIPNGSVYSFHLEVQK